MESDIIKFFCIGSLWLLRKTQAQLETILYLNLGKQKQLKLYLQESIVKRRNRKLVCVSRAVTFPRRWCLSLWSSSFSLCIHAPGRPQRAHQHNLPGRGTGHRARTGAADGLRSSGTPLSWWPEMARHGGAAGTGDMPSFSQTMGMGDQLQWVKGYKSTFFKYTL